ncbi:MAG: glycosyltransferase family 2 protein [Chloroflexota bacterium]
MPSVSIIVPCYNERQTIGLLLSAIYAQTYPRSEMEVVIADGLSSDGTREAISRFAETHPGLPVRVADNAARTIPSGLNEAIRASTGEIVIRLDAHSSPYPDYVARSVEALEAGKGENVGGVWEIRPQDEGWQAQSIAVAAGHPLGVGDALYRHATSAAYVDTVPFGAFRRRLIEQVGFFDETLLTNEDYEFNARILQTGGRIWLDPAIRSVYFARPTLAALWKQYWRYGFWKFRMLKRYPKTLRWRQALPPLFVFGLVGGFLAALWLPVLWLPYAAAVGSYLVILFLAGLRAAAQKKKLFLSFGLPLAILTMHVAWGSGFLGSIFSTLGVGRNG